jgi:hypothetical protein
VLDDCQKLLGQIGNSDPVSWNIVLSGFSRFRIYDAKVMRLFYTMHIGGTAKPNFIIVATVTRYRLL